VKVYLGGVEQLSGWSVDTTTGLVTFSTAPGLGVEVTADFEFDVPVQFITDHMAVIIESYRLHAWQQIPIVELRTLGCGDVLVTFADSGGQERQFGSSERFVVGGNIELNGAPSRWPTEQPSRRMEKKRGSSPKASSRRSANHSSS
jgi:hypothetical protein